VTYSIKVITTVSVLLAVLIFSGIYTTRSLYTNAGIIESQINMVENSVKAGDWAKVKALLEDVEEKWSRTEKSWTMLLDHIEIDYIDIALTRLKSYIEAEDKSLTLGEIATLRQYIRHIPEKESFKLKNLL
jgi:hypothetical protein